MILKPFSVQTPFQQRARRPPVRANCIAIFLLVAGSWVGISFSAYAGPEELADDFSSGLSKWEVPEGHQARATTVDGMLRLNGIGAGVNLRAPADDWADFILRFRMRMSSAPVGDGHTGWRLRTDVKNPKGEMMIFFRPSRAAFSGSGRTEASIGPTPGYSAQEWHSYRITATSGSVELEIDGRVIGAVHGVQNTVGGISFYAYNCAVECDSVRITRLARPALASKRKTPIDLPPRPSGPPPDPDSLTQSAPVVLYADSPSPGPWPVVIPVADLTFPEAPNPTSLTLLDANGRPCPTQFDDMDGDGKVSESDEIVAMVELERGTAYTFRLAYSTGKKTYGARSLPGFRVIRKKDGFPRIGGELYELEWSQNGAFYYKPKAMKQPAIHSRHGEADRVLSRRLGPIRATVIVGRDVKDNGRFTRRMTAYSTHFEITSTLAAADSERDAFVQPLEALHLDLYTLDVVSKLWQRGADGYVSSSADDGPPVKQWYPARRGSLAWDLVYPECKVIIAHHQSPDYTPGLSLVGKHRYIAQGIAFGWRPPVPIRAAAPHVQTTWIVNHTGDMQEFSRLEKRLRSPIRVFTPQRAATLCRNIARKTTLLAQAFTRLPGVSPQAKQTLQEAADATRAFKDPSAVQVADLAKAIRAKVTLDSIDLGAEAAAAREALEVRARQLPGANKEVTPARCWLRKAMACAAQAKLDLRLEHPTRGAERLARAARFAQQANEYIARAPGRVLPQCDAAPIFPYVTFSEGVGPVRKDVGFDVGHFWTGWGHHFPDRETEPEKNVWRFEILDKPFETAKKCDMRIIPLLNWSMPRWMKKLYSPDKADPNAPPGSTGDIRLVDPAMLDKLPSHMSDFADYITAVAKRHGNDPAVLVWSVRNEPAYYETGGINGEWMMSAFKNWIPRKYPDIARLNRNWGTKFADFDAVVPPRRWEENKPAWYDLMTFKAECLAGELRWEADLITAHSSVKFTGAKFVPACIGPQAARSGYGVAPWISAKVQQGVALVDMYLNDLDTAALRTAELHWSAGSVPVISCETGPITKPKERPFRWHYYPDRIASAYAWTMYQYGMFGVHYWTWAGAEEYGIVDWDGSLCDFALEAALANQEFYAARGILSNLRPIGDVGYFYPRATFVQGGRAEVESYEQLYNTLDGLGYHLRILSDPDLPKLTGRLEAIVVPPAPYLERAALDGLKDFANAGGHVVFVGPPPRADEYLHPMEDEATALIGASPGGNMTGETLRMQIGEDHLTVPNKPVWTLPKLKRAVAVCTWANGSPAVTRHVIGKGDVTWIPMGTPIAGGLGTPLDVLPKKWRFAFGDSWQQAPGVANTSTEGHTDRGMKEGWLRRDFDDSKWDEIVVPGVWEELGHPNVDGWGWYRCSFQLPPEVRAKRIVFRGDTLDDRADIYINGVLVKETSTWNEKFEVELTPHLARKGRNVLAIRILDTCFLGGVRGNVAIVCPDVPSSTGKVVDATLRALSIEPRVTGRVAGVIAHVLQGAGVNCLVATNIGRAAADVELSVVLGPGVGVQDRLLDMLTGRVVPCRRTGNRLVVPLRLSRAETFVLPLSIAK